MSKPNIRTMKDGREICDLKTHAGRAEYKRRKQQMWERDKAICWLCGSSVSDVAATFDHRDGRGGGKRDDRIENNGIAHGRGNACKASIRYEVYMQLPLEQRRKNCGVL